MTFEHSCKGTCSGWQAGYDKARKEAEQILVKALEDIDSDQEQFFKNGSPKAKKALTDWAEVNK